jgi:hypothetical protein
MSDQSDQLRRLLIESEEISPALRKSYQEELDAMLNPKLTPRRAAPGVLLLVILLACTAGIVRNMLVYDVNPVVLLGWSAMVLGFVCAAYYIARDLWFRRHRPKTVFSIAHVLTGTAGAITVVSLIIGLAKPSDPASMFGAFYTFVFYFACTSWSLDSRVVAAELAAREQMLRIEYRLADLAGRLNP